MGKLFPRLSGGPFQSLKVENTKLRASLSIVNSSFFIREFLSSQCSLEFY